MSTAPHLPESDPILQELTHNIKSRLGPALRAIWLFGSRARGDATPDSDYDLVVVADGEKRDIEELVVREGYEMTYQHFALVSTLCYTPDDWELAQNTPLGRNVRKEGVRLF